MALSKGETSIGSHIEATTELGTDELEATYAALTGWTESDEQTQLGSHGATTNVVTYTTIKNGVVNKRLAFTDFSQVALSFANNPEDPLQALLKAAAKSKDRISVRENLETDAGTVTSYFQAYVSSAITEPGDGSNITMFTSNLEITSEIVEVLPV